MFTMQCPCLCNGWRIKAGHNKDLRGEENQRSMRWLVLASMTFVALSGCLDNPQADSEAPEATPADQLQRILIRGYLDGMGTPHDDDDVFRVRFAAVTQDTQIVPFDGFVKVFLEPQNGHSDSKAWIPRFWWGDVQQNGFTTDTELPYWEYTADGQYLEPGEPVQLRIEARLPDGRIIEGERQSYA